MSLRPTSGVVKIYLIKHVERLATAYRYSHGGNLGGRDVPGNDVLLELGVFRVTQIGHSAPSPTLVFHTRVLYLREDMCGHMLRSWQTRWTYIPESSWLLWHSRWLRYRDPESSNLDKVTLIMENHRIKSK